MALNYEVKKKVFGFDQTKTEKYVAQLKTLGIIQFGDLCDEVTKIGMAGPAWCGKDGSGWLDRHIEH